MANASFLRAVRKGHGLTQVQLAVRAGTTQSAISRIEKNGVSPTLETVERLLAVMGERLSLVAESSDAGHDRSLLRFNLELSPAERFRRGVELVNFVLRNRGVAGGRDI